MAPYNGFGKRRPSDQPPVLTPAEAEALRSKAQADGAEALAGLNRESDAQPTGSTRAVEDTPAASPTVDPYPAPGVFPAPSPGETQTRGTGFPGQPGRPGEAH
jgi:cell division protease FtsH